MCQYVISNFVAPKCALVRLVVRFEQVYNGTHAILMNVFARFKTNLVVAVGNSISQTFELLVVI